MPQFSQKHPSQYSALEERIVRLCSQVIRDVRADTPSYMTESNQLRRMATASAEQLMSLDTEFGFGHVRALRILSDLEGGIASYRASVPPRHRRPGSHILFDSYSPHEPDATLLLMRDNLDSRLPIVVKRIVPRVHRAQDGWRESAELHLKPEGSGRFRLEYAEIGDTGQMRYTHLNAFVGELKRFGFSPEIDGWALDQSSQPVLLQSKGAASHGIPIKIRIYLHNAYQVQINFEISNLEADRVIEISKVVLEGISTSPREQYLLDSVKNIPNSQRLEGLDAVSRTGLTLQSGGLRVDYFENLNTTCGKVMLAKTSYDTWKLTALRLRGDISDKEYRYGSVRAVDIARLIAVFKEEGLEGVVFFTDHDLALREVVKQFVAEAPDLRFACFEPSKRFHLQYVPTFSTFENLPVDGRELKIPEFKQLIAKI